MVSKFPLIKIFDYDLENKLIYDARRNIIFLYPIDEMSHLEKYFLSGEIDNSIRKVIKVLNDRDIFLPGAMDFLDSTEDKKIKEKLSYFKKNILMRKFVIEITEKCNFRCRYCFNSQTDNARHHSSKQMSLDTAKKSIDYYMKTYIDFYKRLDDKHKQILLKYFNPTIGFYGGEPTMNIDVVIDATKYLYSLDWENYGISKSNINVTLNTNLSHISNKFLSFIINYNIMLFASLDGPREYNDLNRIDINGNGTFNVSYTNLMKIKETNSEYFKNKVNIMAVQTDNCNREINKKFLETLGCNIQYLEQSPYGCFVSEPLKKTYDLDLKMKKIIEKKIKFIEQYKNINFDKCIQQLECLYFLDDILTELPTNQDIPNTFLSCPMGIDNIMIGVNGDMHICHKTDGSMPFGNVYTGIDDKKFTKLYMNYIETTNNNECRSCWAFHFCPFCAASRMKNGKFHNPTKDECDYIRKEIEFNFIFFIEVNKRDPEIIEKVLEYKRDLEHYKSIVDFNKFIMI